MTQLASFASSDFTPDRLLAGPADELISRQITLISGQNLVRGTVLGKIALGAVTSAAKSGGNTGGGTCTVDGTTPLLANAQVGVYTARCIATATNSGTFEVKDPKGQSLGQAVVGTAFSDQIKFALADSGTDFALGDGFDITVAAGSGKYNKSLSAAVDGSQTPDLVLAEDCDASGGDKVTVAYSAGHFNEASLTLGTAHTVDTIREGLRGKDINLVKVYAA